MRTDELREIREAIEGLMYPSETDAPFEVVRWAGSGAKDAREIVAGGRRVKEMDVEAFFAELEEAPEAERFGRLREALERELSEVRVLRVGERRIDVYVVGRMRGGDWAGVRTVSVET